VVELNDNRRFDQNYYDAIVNSFYTSIPIKEKIFFQTPFEVSIKLMSDELLDYGNIKASKDGDEAKPDEISFTPIVDLQAWFFDKSPKFAKRWHKIEFMMWHYKPLIFLTPYLAHKNVMSDFIKRNHVRLPNSYATTVRPYQGSETISCLLDCSRVTSFLTDPMMLVMMSRKKGNFPMIVFSKKFFDKKILYSLDSGYDPFYYFNQFVCLRFWHQVLEMYYRFVKYGIGIINPYCPSFFTQVRDMNFYKSYSLRAYSGFDTFLKQFCSNAFDSISVTAKELNGMADDRTFIKKLRSRFFLAYGSIIEFFFIKRVLRSTSCLTLFFESYEWVGLFKSVDVNKGFQIESI